MASSFLKKKAEEQAKKLDEKYGQNAYGGSKWREEQEKKTSGGSIAAGGTPSSSSKNDNKSNTTSNTTNNTTSNTGKASSFLQRKAKEQAAKVDKEYGTGKYGGSEWRETVVPRNATPVADKTKLNDGYTIESIRQNFADSQTTLEAALKRLEESKAVLTGSESKVTDFLKKYGATGEDIHEKVATKYGATLNDAGEYIFADELSLDNYKKEIAALSALYDQYNADVNAYNTLYDQYQTNANQYNEWYGRLEGYEQRDATLKDLLWNSLKQGYYNSIYGQESYKKMTGGENQADAYKELLSGEDYQFKTDNWLETGLSGAANQLGQQFRQWTDPRSIASGTAFATGAAIMGQTGPQIALPEEVITVPGAFITGMQAGSAAANFEIEGGLAYQEMLEQGISPETARVIGMAVGGGNAALEALQADELIKGLKVFNNKKGYESVTGLIWDELKRRFPNVANQVLQEVAQEGVTIGGTQLGSYIDKGELAYTTPDVLERLGETALSSTLTFGLMDVPGATVNVAANKANVNRLGEIGSEYKTDPDAVIAEGLEMPKNTEAYKTATELKAKVDAGQTVTEAELGRAVVANERAIQQNQEQTPVQAAETPQETLENLARETVAQRENIQQAKRMAGETVSEKSTVPVNAMSENNPVRQQKVVETRSLEKKLGYGENGLKLFKEIAAENQVDTSELMVRFDTPYQAGLTGLPVEKASIANDFQMEAYKAGLQDYNLRQEQNKARKPSTVYSEKESGFDFTNAPSDLTQEQKDFAVFVNKKLGVQGLFNGYDGVNYNAKYTKGTGVVAFAQDFGIDSKLMKKLGSMDYQQKVEKLSETRGKSFVFYFAHEVADHVASDRAPEAMRAFNNAMYNYRQSKAGGENLARSRQAFYADNNVDLTTEGAIEEVGADSILMLYDGDEQKFMDAMKRVLNGEDQQAKEGAKVYKNWLDKTIQKLKSWVRKLTGKENAEARANLRQGISELEQLRNMFESAIAEAAKNVEMARAASETVTALKDDVFYTDQNYSLKITDKKLIEFLENQEYIVTYKAMQQVGKNKDLHPPMAAKVKGPDGKYAWGAPSEIGAWQQATEDPSHITKFKEKNGETVGYYTLNKGNGKNVQDVAYAPYEHSSNYVINDQFDEAYLRDNLVVVECHIPVSEMGGTYKAQYAHNATGIHNWKKGDVGNALAKHGKVRKVYLTRYLKPVRVLSDAEVAQKYKEILGDVAVPFNVVTPNLLAELEKIGVAIDYKGSKMYQGRERVAAEKATGKPAKKKKAADTGEQFSLKDNYGRTLSKEQQEFFKDSKVRDEQGNLLTVYHGTENGGFTTFEKTDDIGYFFTRSLTLAHTYSGGGDEFAPAKLKSWDEAVKLADENDMTLEYNDDGYWVLSDGWDETTWGEDELRDVANEILAAAGDIGRTNYEVYLNLKDPLIVDGKDANWDDITGSEFQHHIEIDANELEVLIRDRSTYEVVHKLEFDDYEDLYQKLEGIYGNEGEAIDDLMRRVRRSGDIDFNDLDAGGYFEDDIDIDSGGYWGFGKTTRQWVQDAVEMGHDGVIFRNIVDEGKYGRDYGGETDVFVALNPEQIKSVSNTEPTSDPDIRYSLKDQDYMNAVNAGDMETAQRMVDEAAKTAGYTRKQFHETKGENVIHVFDLSLNTNASADYGTPFGVFTKSHSRSVGLGGKQMPLFVKADRTLRVKDRTEIAAKLPAEYSRLVNAINRIDDEYGQRYESLSDEVIFGFDAWLDENDPGDKMRKAWDVLRPLEEQFGDVLPEEILSAEREFLRVGKEWEAKTNQAIMDAKVWITKWLRDNHYDSMELEFDNGAGNRVTDALIVLDPNQVKSADPVTYDDAGNVIPLSQRFNEKNDDIRYSIKSTAHAAGLDVTRDDKGKVVFKMDGKTVTKVTPEHIKKNSGLGGLITVAAAKGNITQAEANDQYKAMADIMNMIMNTQDPDLVWAWVGASMFSALKKNADGQYGTTIDFTTVCRKTQDIITAMSRAMMKMKRGLSKDEVTKLQAELITEGSSVPCPVCYVFSRWAGIGSILDNMYRWQEKYDGYTDEQLRKRVDELTEKLGKGKAKDLKKMLREQDEEYDSLDHESEMLSLEKKQLTAKRKKAIRENNAHMLRSVDDRMSEVEKRIPQVKKRMNEIKASVAPELAWLLQVRTDPDYAKQGKVKPSVLFNLDDAATFAESYPLAWKYRTSRGPSAGKAILPYSDMRLGDMILGVDSNSATGNDLFANVTGEFTDEQMAALDKAIKRTKAQNLIGGQRFQSTSDFRYDYALDYLMAFFECQALGSKLQTYTKIIEFADMVAAVRGDVNLSVMPKNKGYITTSDGVNRLVFSSVTGIDFEAAKRANELHDSAQLILVGINDNHILAALEDSEETLGKYIGFVIPYHASGASINEFIRVLVSNLGESFTLSYYQDYSDVQSDKERSNATADQKRRNDLRSKLLKGKDGGKNWEPSADDLAFIRGESVDITGRSFADLRAVERRALRGDKAAIAEYQSWTAGALWDLYNKMWVEGGAEYGVRLNTKQAKAVMPHEYWNKTVNRDKAYINGFLFRSYCYNLGLTPRFSGATVKGEKHGDFTDSKGYWKTLIDRPMYNNDGTYRDQQTINVTGFQKDMLTADYAKEHWAGYSVQEPDVVRAGRAADRFIEKSQNGQYSLKGEHEMRREIDRIRSEGKKAGKSKIEIENEVMGVVGPEYGKLLKTYGEIKRGERPYREISVPRLTEKGRKVSQTVRTILEAEVTPDAAVPTLQELITQGDFSYDVYTDKAALATAEATILDKGYETALADWLSDVKNGKVNKTNTALGWALYNAAATKGDLKTAMTVLNGMVQHQRNAAQALQATRILKKMAPDAQLYGIQRSVKNLKEELVEKYGKNAPDLEIDEELAKKFLEAKTDEERDEATREIYMDIGRQMPATFMDKWNAWRYLAMLGNPRTHVRNVVGNLGFAPVVMAKDMTATAIESVVGFVSKGKLGRTKAMPNAKLLKAAWEDYANVADQVTAGGKYSDSFMQNQYIQEGREIFKFKPLEKARKGNSAALEVEDMWFAQPHYAFALAQYCKAHGVTADQLRNGKALGNARAYAIKEAQKATYRDANSFSEAVAKAGRYSGDNKWLRRGSTLVEGVLPFRKTPANILVRGIEYSPIGLLNGIKQALVDVRKGTKTGAEAIDSFAAGLTGTVLLRLGIYLAAEGLIRGAGGDDEEEKKFEELQGHQAYALELPGGKSITLDWLAPEALPLFIGVNLYELAKENKGQSNLSDIFKAVTSVGEPLLKMSCLQGLNDLLDSNKFAGDLPAVLKMPASAATSYLTQAFPTILGQAERSAQDKRMTTYTEKNGFLTSDMQYTLGKISAKTPGWDFNQIPYVDAWGRTESTGSKAGNIFNNFLNPAYMSQIETSEMEKELARLHDEKGDEYSVLPSRPSKYFNVDGDRKDLTAEEYVKYATEKGQLSYDILTDLTGRKEYDTLPDAEKAEAVELAYEYASAIAKTKVSDYEPDNWVAKALEAEEFSGMDETEYILYKVALGMADQNNNGNDSYDNTEKAAAIASMPSLSDADIAVLLDSKTSYAAYDAGVDMRSLMGYIGEGNDVNIDKLIGAKEAGISEAAYFKYTDTLKAVDQPNSKGELGGAATNAEKAAAVAQMSDLDNQGIAYLWGTDQAHEAHSYGVDMRKYAQFKGVVDSFKGDDKQQQIKSYLKGMNLSAKDYLYLYGTVYSSVKDDADYLYYFGN